MLQDYVIYAIRFGELVRFVCKQIGEPGGYSRRRIIPARSSRERVFKTRGRDNCRHSKPIQFADDSAVLSGNYFRGLPINMFRAYPPRALPRRIERTASVGTRSLAIDRDAHHERRDTHAVHVRIRGAGHVHATQ